MSLVSEFIKFEQNYEKNKSEYKEYEQIEIKKLGKLTAKLEKNDNLLDLSEAIKNLLFRMKEARKGKRSDFVKKLGNFISKDSVKLKQILSKEDVKKGVWPSLKGIVSNLFKLIKKDLTGIEKSLNIWANNIKELGDTEELRKNLAIPLHEIGITTNLICNEDNKTVEGLQPHVKILLDNVGEFEVGEAVANLATDLVRWLDTKLYEAEKKEKAEAEKEQKKQIQKVVEKRMEDKEKTKDNKTNQKEKENRDKKREKETLDSQNVTSTISKLAEKMIKVLGELEGELDGVFGYCKENGKMLEISGNKMNEMISLCNEYIALRNGEGEKEKEVLSSKTIELITKLKGEKKPFNHKYELGKLSGSEAKEIIKDMQEKIQPDVTLKNKYRSHKKLLKTVKAKKEIVYRQLKELPNVFK